MGIISKLDNKGQCINKNGKTDEFRDSLSSEEQVVYDACVAERAAYDLSLNKYAAEPLNILKNQDAQDPDMIMYAERYNELRHINGIWSQDIDAATDISSESKVERSKFRLTLPQRKKYFFSCVLFDNCIGRFDTFYPAQGWELLNNAVSAHMDPNTRSYEFNRPCAWYSMRNYENANCTTEYMRSFGIADDICDIVPEFTDTYDDHKRRWLVHKWIHNSAYNVKMTEVGAETSPNICSQYALKDTRGIDAYNTICEAAIKKTGGALEMFRDELNEIIERVSYSMYNPISLFPVDVLSADEAGYQLLFNMPFKGLDRQQTENMIYYLDKSVRMFSNILDLVNRLGVAADVLYEVPAVKMWLNDNSRCAEAFLECIEKGLFKDEYFENTKYIGVQFANRDDFEMLKKWYETNDLNYLPKAHHVRKGSFKLIDSNDV